MNQNLKTHTTASKSLTKSFRLKTHLKNPRKTLEILEMIHGWIHFAWESRWRLSSASNSVARTSASWISGNTKHHREVLNFEKPGALEGEKNAVELSFWWDALGDTTQTTQINAVDRVFECFLM